MVAVPFDRAENGDWPLPPPLPAHTVPLSSTAPPPDARAAWPWIVAGSLAALAALAALATESLRLGSPRGRWVYRFIQPFSPGPFLVALAASVPAIALLRLGLPRSRRGEWGLVLAWIALATGIQAALRALTPFTFESIFVSPGANSFYTATQWQPLSAVLASFVEVRDGLPLHAQSNMPGKLVLMYALVALTANPAVLAWVVVVLSNLGALLMYWFVRRLFDDPTIALYAAILYLFVPAKLFFFPLMNTVTPVVVLGLACLVVQWLRTGRYRWAAAVGVMLYGIVLFEPLPLVLGLLFGALAVRAVLVAELTWGRLIAQTVVALAACALVGVAMYLAWGFDTVTAFQSVRAHALEFNRLERRPYDVWIRANLLEFIVGTGVSQAVLLAGAIAIGCRGPAAWSERLTRPMPLMALALVVTVLAIDLIGVNRGEVIRLWIFLACLFQVPAACLCARAGRRALAIVLVTTLLLAALGTANIGFVVPA